MEKHKKQIRILYWCIVVLGSALLGIAMAAVPLSDGAKRIGFICWMTAVVLAAIAIDVLWYRQLTKTLTQLNLILTEECNPDLYIAKLNELLEGKRSLQLRQIRYINLAAAYCDKKEYQKARTFLLQVKPSKLTRLNRAIYWANMALVQFYLNEGAAASAILEQQKQTFSQVEKEPQLREVLAILAVFSLLEKGEKEEAKTQLAEARKAWASPRNADDFAYLQSLIDVQEAIS